MSNAARQGGRFNLDDYVTVSERVERFHEKYPDGRIITSIIELNHETGFVLMQAMVYRTSADAHPAATGHAFEVRGDSYINKTSFVENCESSAVGRALALLGFEVRRGIASREEIEKAARMQAGDRSSAPAAATGQTARPPLPPAAEEAGVNLDAEILQSAEELGYDAAKVHKWINQKFEVTGGLASLTDADKREVLKIFSERAQAARAK